MVMMDLFHHAGFLFGVAHCNFTLRGAESDADEDLVREKAGILNVPFFVKRFDTSSISRDRGISIQMAARDLRYAWFNELLSKGYDYVATAHHLDDEIETFFINLTRQTGIAGFHGILPKKEKLVRPMLFTNREQIARYATENNIIYREDSSNSDSKYLRNKVRHEILPLFREINPGIHSVFTSNIHRLRETEKIYLETVEKHRKQIVINHKNNVIIPLEKLKALEPLTTYAFEFISPYGFNYSVVDEIFSSEHISGKIWLSPTHRLVLDRASIIITELNKNQDTDEIQIIPETESIEWPLNLTFEKIQKTSFFKLDPSPSVANLDASKIKFPLTIRRWKEGDFFHPFGSNGKKKLSDFFIDQKLSIPEKEEVWLLCSGEQIIWVIGFRIDDRYKIDDETKEVLVIKKVHR